MKDEPEMRPAKAEPTLADQIGQKAERKLHARKQGDPGVWSGLGMMGIVGWSVAVPTLLGAALGLWLDREYPGSRSWTLALLVAGLILGCINAWHWVAKEEKSMREEQEENEDE
jgi:ATP synthase protein I